MKVKRIWRAVQGEGSELGKTPLARGSPPVWGEGSELGARPGLKVLLPSASPRAGVERAKGVESGWWRDAESRDNEGRTYLVIYRRLLVCLLDKWCNH